MSDTNRQLRIVVSKLLHEMEGMKADKEAEESRLRAKSGEELTMPILVKFLMEDREHMKKALAVLTDKVRKINESLAANEQQEAVAPEEQYQVLSGNTGDKEIPLSDVEVKILDFIRKRGMACADDVKQFMSYKGRNAACARLMKLHKEGLLEPVRLGHKIYYRDYAGKTTKTLIISPPQ